MGCSHEFNPAPQKVKLAFFCVVMPPGGVCSSWYQANSPVCIAFDHGFLVRFFHPATNLPPVGWVHPTSSLPVLQESVHFFVKIIYTLSTFFGRADIQSKFAVFVVQVIKQILRGCPLASLAGHHARVNHGKARSAQARAPRLLDHPAWQGCDLLQEE